MHRVGIDLGGTKIEGVVLDSDGHELSRRRISTPAGDYQATLNAIVELIRQLREHCNDATSPVGICTPGTPSRRTGVMKNCNSICLNGKALQTDLEHQLGTPIALANDANCLALSEWHDGAAAGHEVVFAVILGTGVGGGLLVNGHIVDGAGGVGGEWGHVPLPYPDAIERPGPLCYCGQHGCMEQWCSGPAFSADHASRTGQVFSPEQIVEAVNSGDADAMTSINHWLDRLARGLATVCNIIDPNVIVVGGGLSSIGAIYDQLPDRMSAYVFSDELAANIVQAEHGDASGVRGAARLHAD